MSRALALLLLGVLVPWPAPVAADPAEVVPPATVRMRDAALLLSGQEGGELGLVLRALPLPGDGPAFTVLVLMELTGALPAAADAAAGPLEIYLYALGEGQVVLDSASGRLAFPAPDPAAVPLAGLRLVAPLTLPAGNHRLRVLARTADDRLGLRSGTVEVPASGATVGSLLPPFGDGPAGRWQTVQLHGTGDDAVLPLPAAWPGVRLVAPAGKPLTLILFTSDSLPADGALEARLAGEDGTRAQPLSIEGPAATTFPGLEAVRLTLGSAALAPGSYALTASLTTPGGEEIQAPPVPLEILAPDGELASRDALSPPVIDSGAEAVPLADLATTYGNALRTLAAGDEPAAEDALLAFEASLAARFPDRLFTVLGGVHNAVLQPMGDAFWPLALPVIQLHARLARRHRAAAHYALGVHATQTAARLAMERARALATPAAATTSASLLTGLASDLLQAGAVSAAATRLNEALALDPEHAPALLGTAVLEEKNGHYRAAADALRRLLRVEAGHLEGRLRLATCLRRLGEKAEARELLQNLARRLPRQGATAWVLPVAHQELISLEIEAGDLASARRRLERALRRWPDHPTFGLQRAYVHDLEGEHAAARTRLAAVESAPTERGGERFLYNRWPLAALAAGREELNAEAAAARPSLAALLAEEPPEEAP